MRTGICIDSENSVRNGLFFVIFEFLLCDKFVILKLVIVICLRRIIGEKERKI